MFDLKDPRCRERLAVEADVAPETLKRFLAHGDAACRPSSVRRIREARARLEAAARASEAPR